MINCAGPSAQPIFQPVAENVLPDEEMRMVRSRMPGKTASGRCSDVVEDQVLVHLVADDQQIVLDGQLGDPGQLLDPQHGAGRDCAGS